MASGWTRMILEDFEFDFEVVYPSDITKGNLRERFDVLLFEDGAIPSPSNGSGGDRGRGSRILNPASIPEQFRDRLGLVTANETVPKILEFARSGGSVIAIGSSSVLAYYADLRISDHLIDNGESLSKEQYYTPGSIHSLKLEHITPLTHGLGERLDVIISHLSLIHI